MQEETRTTTEEESQHCAQSLQRRRSLILAKLLEAKSHLDMLGVSLVVVEIKRLSSASNNEILHQQSNDEEGKGGAKNEQSGVNNRELIDDDDDTTTLPTERILHRQSDEKVVADMMASLRTLIEASSSLCVSNHTDVSDQHQQYYHYHLIV